MSAFRSALFSALLLAAAPFLRAQQPASQPEVPLPAPLVSAQKVFVANGGAEPVLAKAFSEAALSNEPYTSFYSALSNWGHWQLLSSPGGADLILVISADAAPNSYFNGNPNYDLDLTLRILDGKTRSPLWTLRQPLEGAMLKSSFEKNYRNCVAGLITQVKELALPRAQTP
jgi:hypothetical protein